jgi:predicted porin
MRHFLLLLSIPGLACAEGGVTVFGVVDTFVARIAADGLPAVTRVDASGLLASRIGLRGREDLGGGYAAGFLLEAGLNSDDGSQADGNRLFNRQAWVSLSGPLGEVRLGRQNTPQFYMNGKFDAFTSATQASGWNNLFGAPPRADNVLGIFSPSMGGFRLQALLARGAAGGAAPLEEGAANRNTHLAAEYESGGLYLGANWQSVRTAASSTVARRSSAGGSYAFPGGGTRGWTLYASAGRERRADGTQDTRLLQLSAQYRFSPRAALGFGWAGLHDRLEERMDGRPGDGRQGTGHGDARQLGLLYRYWLSIRTTLYGAAARLGQQGGRSSFALLGAAVVAPAAQVRSPLPGGDIRGLQAGILHTF